MSSEFVVVAVMGTRRAASEIVVDVVMSTGRAASEIVVDVVMSTGRAASEIVVDVVMCTGRAASEIVVDVVMGTRRAASVNVVASSVIVVDVLGGVVNNPGTSPGRIPWFTTHLTHVECFPSCIQSFIWGLNGLGHFCLPLASPPKCSS
jgi:hypothetical protein